MAKEKKQQTTEKNETGMSPEEYVEDESKFNISARFSLVELKQLGVELPSIVSHKRDLETAIRAHLQLPARTSKKENLKNLAYEKLGLAKDAKRKELFAKILEMQA